MNANFRLVAIAVLFTASIVAAGCTTKIETKQTEPFRIQLDGSPQTFQAQSSGGSCCQTQKVIVENSHDAEQCDVKVQVKQTSTEKVKLLIRVEDETTHEVLATKTIEVGGTTSMSNSSSPAASTNASANATTTSAQASSTAAANGQSVEQTINVNIKGKNNFVVITEAQQGSADVNIAAVQAGNR